MCDDPTATCPSLLPLLYVPHLCFPPLSWVGEKRRGGGATLPLPYLACFHISVPTATREESLHLGQQCYPPHPDHCVLHSCSISPVLRRAASHLTTGETRQRPKTTNKNHKNRRPVEKTFSHDLFDPDFHNATLVHFFVRLFRKNEIKCFWIVSTVLSVTCNFTGCCWSRRLQTQPFVVDIKVGYPLFSCSQYGVSHVYE